ncbi:hypothetical protein OUZ56_025999 [Daphnia magna]|uniref:Uncharacterized protein n=1 Tax=Daphnia magna TaxID=35525 RepID=A0ABQ9ZKJ4_9CRUS|nr:hypothetical protein OUZ56_025999 [Daphnia magna]
MSASPRSHTRTYLVLLDRPWTSFGRNWDVNGTSTILSRLLKPHGLVVTSGAPVSTIGRNSTRDVRQSCQRIFPPVAAVHKSA